MALLELRGLYKSFGAVQVLHDVDLAVHAGEVTALVGDNGAVPVTGQDATVQGLQNILAGDQCMTVYKAIKKEADAASSLAISLAKGEKKTVDGKVTDPTTKQDVPSVLLTPVAITKENVKDVVNDGFVKKEELCAGAYATACQQAGIS